MVAAAELTLLEKSLGLSKGNKYSAQGERQVRSGGGAEGRRWTGAGPAEPQLGGALAGRGGRSEDAAPHLPTCRRRGAGSACSPGCRKRARGWPPVGLGPNLFFW